VGIDKGSKLVAKRQQVEEKKLKPKEENGGLRYSPLSVGILLIFEEPIWILPVEWLSGIWFCVDAPDYIRRVRQRMGAARGRNEKP